MGMELLTVCTRLFAHEYRILASIRKGLQLSLIRANRRGHTRNFQQFRMSSMLRCGAKHG
jgi:hypothetical protein